MIVANTRLCITPTGPLHIGHAWNAILNREVAKYTGGKFQLRFERRLVIKSTAHEAVDAIMHSNVEELAGFGCGPTGGIYTDDMLHDDIGVLWRMVDGPRRWGEYGLFADGEWRAQAQHIVGIEGYADTLDTFLPVSSQSVLPFWVTFSRVAMDMLTGCTMVLRGTDLIPDSQLYALFSTEIHRMAPQMVMPELLYYPLISTNIDGLAAPLSSSAPSRTNGFYLKDLVEAGKDAEWLGQELWRRFVTHPALEGARLKGMGMPGLYDVLRYMRPIVIDRDEWGELLAD